MNAFDIIGDIHGQAEELESLLKKLGYYKLNGTYQNKDRKVIFLGDFIDRGNLQKEVIEIVRPMIDKNCAYAVMGNHEYNAICYATHDPNGGFLRKHSDKNFNQHKAFLKAYESNLEEYQELLEWFKKLPLWIDFDGFRVIHACWDDVEINRILKKYKKPVLTDEFLYQSTKKNNWEYQAIEVLLKGKEVSLPNGESFFDKDGNERTEMRVSWWSQEVSTYRDMFLGPEDTRKLISSQKIKEDCLVGYSKEEPPVFFGHYWMSGKPIALASNIACVDWSVAKKNGKLVAYSWMGEKRLQDKNFSYVERKD